MLQPKKTNQFPIVPTLAGQVDEVGNLPILPNQDDLTRRLLVEHLGGKAGPIYDEVKSAVEQFGNAMMNPSVRETLTNVALAASASSPHSWQYQLAAGAKKMETDKKYRETLAKVLGGQAGSAIVESGLPAQQASQVAQLAQNQEALGIRESGTMPWEKEYELALLKIMKPSGVPNYPATITKAVNDKGEFTPHQLHLWGYDPQTQNYDKYLGPKTMNEQEGTAAVNNSRRAWFALAVNNAIKSPELQKYAKGGITTDSLGNITVQWTNPEAADAVLRNLVKNNLSYYSKIGMIPSEWLNDFDTYWNAYQNIGSGGKKVLNLK